MRMEGLAAASSGRAEARPFVSRCRGGRLVGHRGSFFEWRAPRCRRPKIWDTTARVPPTANYSLGNASLRMREKSFAALRPVANTSSWLSVVDESPVAKFAIQENPASSISSARA